MKEHEASQSSIRAVVWLSLAILVFIARIVTDIISLASNTYSSTAAVGLRLIFGMGFIASSAYIVWSYAQTNSYRGRKDFFTDFGRLIVLLAVGILPFGDSGAPAGFSDLVTGNLLTAERMFATLYLVVFLHRAINLQRTSQTRRYTRVIVIGSVVAYFLSFVGEYAMSRSMRVIVMLLCVVLAIIMVLAVKRRNWVLLLAAKEKRRLLLLTFLGMCASMVAAAESWDTTSELHTSLRHSSYGFQAVMAYGSVFLAIFCERTFWTVLFSLPNSSMVERRTFEFSSVAYLNRIAAESTDLDKLYTTVTQLAMQATRGSAAFSFSIGESGVMEQKAAERLTVKQIEALNDSDILQRFVNNLSAPYNVEFISENTNFSFLSRSVESFAQSMIVAPLRSGRELVGAVVVIHAQPFSFETDDVQAVAAFASSASVAIENARLVEDSLEKERYHKELLVGREIQKKLLPQTNPKLEGYDVYGLSSPALEVGGDYYDFYHLADGSPCVLIADVSGKGISAAFYMAKLKGVALALARQANTARELVENINATLFGTMERQMYITLMAVHLGPKGLLSIVRAGHTPALLVDPAGSHIIRPKGLGIGLAKPDFFATCIQSDEVQLAEDASLLLFTDGINEARNVEGDEFGFERLESALMRGQDSPRFNAEFVAQTIMRDVAVFSNHSMQHDDMTLIVIRRTMYPSIEPHTSSTSTLQTLKD